MSDKTKDSGEVDVLSTYQQDKSPGFVNLLYIILIIWGVAYAAYFIGTRFDSEAEYDKRQQQTEAR